MKIMPMGDYYVWHCDWCDSTNYTIWTRIEHEGLACAACHQHSFGHSGMPALLSQPQSREITGRSLSL